jgi:electron transfer flavoprotein alpha subunit
MKQDIYVLIEHLQGQVAELSYMMLAAARSIAEDEGSAIVAVFLGHKEQELANDLAASRVLYFDHPELINFTPAIYQKVISALVLENKPRLVLFGDTSIGAEVAGPLSARLNLPLVSYCRNISVREGELRYTSQICGGKILVEGDLPAPTALVTMIPGAYKVEQGRSNQPPVVVWSSVPSMEEQPVKFKRFLEPEVSDVDISKERVLVSLGRGIQNQENIELAEELARVLGGVVCASRPVVDQGWLPTTRLVGKSGKRVRPKLYLALGISGAPEHVEAITGSEMIVAINTDPAAPIFEIAQYGAQVDLLDLLEILAEKARAMKVV